MRDLMARLEWYDADADPRRDGATLRYEQSLEPGEMRLAAQSDELRGDWQDLEGHLRRDRAAATLFCWGMQDAFLTPDYPLMLARMVPTAALRDGPRVAPPAGGAAVGLLHESSPASSPSRSRTP